MSSTSKKHRSFVAEPMKGKKVTDLPGIGPVLGKKFVQKGYNNASEVYGKFLEFKGDVDSFGKWVKEEIGANSKQAKDCATALKGWSENFL